MASTYTPLGISNIKFPDISISPTELVIDKPDKVV